MNDQYQAAMAKSYSNQVGRLTIPAEQLNGLVEIPLGFQPMGIASNGLGKIAIAAYFEPAICLADVSRNKEGLHFEVKWIRDVNYNIQSVRLFPDIWDAGGANRAQTVNFGPANTLWVTRNGNREFFILSAPTEPKGKWALSGVKTLPGEGMVHSALLLGEEMLTIESAQDLEKWFFCGYELPGLEKGTQVDAVPFLYGIGADEGKNHFITDSRCKELPPGIYQDRKMIIPGICGNGICFIAEGALVTKYGQAAPGPFNGEPGSLIFIPRGMFE